MSAAPGHDVLITSAHTPGGQAIVAALARDPAVLRLLCVHARGATLPQSSARAQHVAVDLTRQRDVRDLLCSELARSVDAIVHLPMRVPGEPRPGARFAQPASVTVAQQLLVIAEEQPRIERFVFVSSASVYRLDSDQPLLVDEDHPLELSAETPEVLRESVAADLVACARIGVSRLHIAVLRCAEMLGANARGPLQDYLGSRVCLRPLGFDPMLNVLAPEDAAEAVRLAVHCRARGVFNIPGRDSLPLSELIHAAGRLGLALPGPVLVPLYGLRRLTTAFGFRYRPERRRFHFGAILDGRRAKAELGYEPSHHIVLRPSALPTPADDRREARD